MGRITRYRGYRESELSPFLFSNNICPFCGGFCAKRNGVCEIALSKESLAVCPYRFLKDGVIFSNIENEFPESKAESIEKEVKVTDSFFDYVLLMSKSGVANFCVFAEIQALDTCGSSWFEIAKLLERYLGPKSPPLEPKRHKPLGINWKMTAKTLLMELMKKDVIAGILKTKLFVVVQDSLWEYLKEKYPLASRMEYSSNKTVQWHVYRIEDSGHIALKEKHSCGTGEVAELALSDFAISRQRIIADLKRRFGSGCIGA